MSEIEGEKYDCTNDVLEHKQRVASWLQRWEHAIKSRAEHHDESKLKDPIEKALFDHWTPELRRQLALMTELVAGYEQLLDVVEPRWRGWVKP